MAAQIGGMMKGTGDFDFETLVRYRRSASLNPPAVPEDGVGFIGAEPYYATAPVICEAVSNMAKIGRFGFTVMDDVYADAVVWWWKNVRKTTVSPQWIVPTLGIIHSLAVCIRMLLGENESIIVTSPVYNRYEQAATRLWRNTVDCPLVVRGGRYEMDFGCIERAMAREDTRLFVLCNPHNPIGQVWTVRELSRLTDLAAQYGVRIFSDEIFAENVFTDAVCTSMLGIPKAAPLVFVASSIGKAFGTTGFNHANLVIPDDDLREAFADRRTREHFGSMDPVAAQATTAAYSEEGFRWLRASNQVIGRNMGLVKDYFAENMPDVKVYGGEGGYILWLDWRSRFSSEAELMEFLDHKANFYADAGSHYGAERFVRISLACPTIYVERALGRLDAAIKDRNG